MNVSNIGGVIAQFIVGGGLLATAIAIFTAKATRKKITNEAAKLGADASAVLTNSALGLIEPYIKQVEFFEKRLEAVELEKEKLETDMVKLKARNVMVEERNVRLNARVSDLEDQVKQLLSRNY